MEDSTETADRVWVVVTCNTIGIHLPGLFFVIIIPPFSTIFSIYTTIHSPESSPPMDSLFALLDTSVIAPFAQAFSANIYVSGIVMVLLNVGTSYLMQDLMPIANRMFAFVWVRRLVFFAIFFTATRDLRVSVLLTIMFTLLVDVFLNEDSDYCLIPYEWRQERNVEEEDGMNEVQEVQNVQKVQEVQDVQDVQKVNHPPNHSNTTPPTDPHPTVPYPTDQHVSSPLSQMYSMEDDALDPNTQWMFPHSSASSTAPSPDSTYPPPSEHVAEPLSHVIESFQPNTSALTPPTAQPSQPSPPSQSSPPGRPRQHKSPTSRYERFRMNADRWALSRRVGYGVRV